MFDRQLITPCLQQARALCGQIDKAIGWCAQQQVPEAELLDSRLAPDMFPLAKQLDFVTAQMLQPLRRLTGQPLEDPAPATEGQLHAYRDRLVSTMALVEAAREAAASADPAAMIVLDLPNGMIFELNAADYVRDWAVPQFYFHVMTAYAILRMRGVPIGKADFVPHMARHARRPIG